MAVSTFQQTDSATQPLTEWAADLDGNVAVLTRLGDMFAPHQQATPNMTAALDPGHVFDGTSLTEVAAQSTSAIIAPSSNPRIDRVVIDQFTGAVSVVTGTEAPSPTPPAIPAGTMPVARILLQTSSTAITNAMITDERDFSFLGGGITGVTAGAGLTGGGTAGSVTISLAVPVSVADGGTGATSAGPTAANNIGALAEANNLSDLANAATARSNLGLGTMATQNATAVAITGGTITGLPAPANPSDAATKAYVDATAQGLSVRNSCAAATAGALPNSPAYNNGTGGVGATLTAGSNGALTVDGYAVATNDRLLVKDQTAGAQNGLYTVTNPGSGSAAYVLTRASDANSSANLVSGIFTFIEQGTTNTGAGFVLTTPNPITVGTTALTFTQFSGAGEITAGTGLSKSGNTISLNPAGTSTIGGVEAFAPVTHQWINSISTSGIPAASQPAFGDIAGQATLGQLPSIANNSVLGNNSGSTGTPTAIGASDVLNMIGTTQGSVLYRNASSWVALAPGSSGQALLTQGASANPIWANVITGVTAGTGLTGGGTSGSITLGLSVPVSVANGGTGATAAGPTAANNIGALAEANNLSDLANAGTARTNLGLGSMATQNANAVAITGGNVTGLPTPTNASDAATKAYVDATAQGLSVRASVNAATAGTLPNSPTYNNGSSGVGATLTAGSNGALSVDGYAVSANDRLLIKDQASGAQNGIYTVTNPGSGSAAYVLTRATDANSSTNLVSGIFTFTEQGTANSGAGFVLTTPNPITVGTTSLTFTQFSGAGEITAGTGLSKSGNTISLNPAAAGTIGGVQAFTAVAHQWINAISTSGIPAASQPAFSDISGQATLTQLPSIANNTFLGNTSGSTTTPSAITASGVLDTLGSAQGDLLYRGASGWTVLTPGSSGQVLRTQGSSANPQWAADITSIVAGTGLTGGGTTGTVTIGLSVPVSVANGGTGATSAGPTAANNIGALAEANNLSDLANAGTARTNLGLGTMATQNANAVAITGGSVTGLPTPTNASDAATKAYVDATAQGLSVRASVNAASTGALPNSPTYNNGSSGVGATLTAGSNGALTVDGYAVVANDRLLIKDQAAGAQNGLYTVTNPGSGSAAYVLTRATDANSSSNLVSGIFTFTEQGTANSGAGFVLTTPNPITVGTTALTFTQFSGAGEITAGTGLSKSGNTISLNPAAAGTIGGVQAFTAVAHQWINSISTSGIPAASQPAFSDLSGQASLTQLPSIASGTFLGNTSGSTTTPSAITASGILDTLGSVQGDILYRSASGWTVLAPGTSGQVLRTQGASANPQWAADITSVTAGTGLTGGGSSGAITIGLSVPISVANGGTGATAAGPTAANNIGALAEANNLSDLANVATARTNLGLGSMATQNAGAVAITGGTITGLPTPTNSSDAATKAYVDATAQGLSVRASVNAASTGALPNSPTYNNGSSGVGATLTAGANGALTIDGYSVSTNDRLLIKDQSAGAQNGIYTVTNPGSGSAAYVLTRATDANSSSNLVSGIFTFTERGTTNSGAGFVLTTPNPITVGTTALTFTQFSGAGEITAGTGLTKSGNTISLTIPVTVANGGTGATSAGPTAANNIGALAEANNLSDLPNAATARTNLGLGSAAVKNASGSGPTVASVSGTIAVGHFAIFADTAGTLQDGGLPSIALGGTYVNSSGTVAPGLYYVDTTAGPITLTVSSTLAGGYTFVDAGNYWGVNNLTVNGGGHPIGNIASNTAATFLANVSDYQFSMVADATYWRLV